MVVINGLEWKVITEKADYKCMGLVDSSNLEIHISRVSNVDNIKRTITHEVVHAFLYSYGFPKIKFNEEELCEFVSHNMDAIAQISQQVYSKIDLEIR